MEPSNSMVEVDISLRFNSSASDAVRLSALSLESTRADIWFNAALACLISFKRLMFTDDLWF